MKAFRLQAVLFLATSLLVFSSCAPQKSAGEKLAEKNKAVANQIYEGFNTWDWDKLATLVSADHVDHNPMPEQKQGFEGLKEMFEMMRAAIPDMKITPLQLVAEGDYVAARMTFSGTHKGDFGGMPATGKSFTIEGYDLLRIAEGKCVEHWGIFDQFGMMMQLGVIPPPGPPTEIK